MSFKNTNTKWGPFVVLTHFAADKRTEKVPGRFVFQTEERRQRDFRKSVWNLDANNTSFNNTCETFVMFVVLYFAILKELTSAM